jgi:DNA-binding CsgD family transcriptional regulator
LSAGARRALVALDAEPVAAGEAEFYFGDALDELKAAGRAFCDCRRGGALTEWKAVNWWIASNDRARGGARVLNAAAMLAHRAHRHVEHADLQQEAVLLVPGLVPKYATGRVPFGAYASPAVRRALLRWADGQPRPAAEMTEGAAAVPRGCEFEGADLWGRVASVVSEQEFDALALVGRGFRTADIARELGVSVKVAADLLAGAYAALRSSGVLSEFQPGESE